ncbi:hypothetical protein [Hymenobacter nivis]|uniref:Uncharacterized protein n=1 Tax=Hymenobacter nivis TaxID=1850093 RepID=A0A502GYN6_9BACT|nr:hypothetical protein [Hymenobacter nivis]TPG66083.1 hypothetical protein EAH73_11990 [Hymenobacter nivis]
MRTPPEYLAAALAQQEAARLLEGGAPLATDAPDTPLVPRATAEAAVALALADAERYRQLLVGAALRSKPAPACLGDCATCPTRA